MTRAHLRVVLAAATFLSSVVAGREASAAPAEGEAVAAPSPLIPAGTADEAPPREPRHHGVVLQSAMGAMGFAGSFGTVAPPAWRFETRLGYEIFDWLMVLAYGEVALTDTSVRQGPTQKRGLTFFGFGGGLRGTIPVTPRFALAVDVTGGAMQADVAHGALANLGYGGLESLGLTLGGGLSAEWYQIDPHLALVASGGARYGFGFREAAGDSSAPLLWEASGALRYTF